MLDIKHVPNATRKVTHFPVIKQGLRTKAIVIFVSELKGIVVDQGSSNLPEGCMANRLIPVNSEDWLDYNGVITLGNAQ